MIFVCPGYQPLSSCTTYFLFGLYILMRVSFSTIIRIVQCLPSDQRNLQNKLEILTKLGDEKAANAAFKC